MYDGPRSPITQTFGLGLFEVPTAADMDKLEQFFTSRQAHVMHEVSPMADKSLLAILNARQYRPYELTSVMCQPLAGRRPSPRTVIRVRLAGNADGDVWARTAAEGWRELTEFADQIHDLMHVSAATEDCYRFMAELDGQPIATGALAIHGGVALLAGASTIPEWRNRGAQRALLDARLDYAATAGCDLAMMGAEPGSASQRNAQRHGFQIAYTRIKWALNA